MCRLFVLLLLVTIPYGCLRMEKTYNPYGTPLIQTKADLTGKVGKSPLFGRVYGFASNDGEHVWLNLSLGPRQLMATLLHEMVHILMDQARNAGWGQVQLRDLEILLVYWLKDLEGAGFDTGWEAHGWGEW